MKTFLAAGVSLGIVAVVLLNLYVNDAIESFQEDPGAVRLLKFAADVGPNSKLEGEMLKQVRLPTGYEGALQGAVSPDELPVVLGKPLPRGARTGQYLLWSMFKGDVASGRPDDIEKILVPGMRLVPIPIDKHAAAGGWIRPGDIVDLIGTFPRRLGGATAREEDETVVFLEKVKVVATGGLTGYSASPDDPRLGNYSDITVLVTPADALKVAHALRTARKIQAFLRNPQDLRNLSESERGINQTMFDQLKPRYTMLQNSSSSDAAGQGSWQPTAAATGPGGR